MTARLNPRLVRVGPSGPRRPRPERRAPGPHCGCGHPVAGHDPFTGACPRCGCTPNPPGHHRHRKDRPMTTTADELFDMPHDPNPPRRPDLPRCADCDCDPALCPPGGECEDVDTPCETCEHGCQLAAGECPLHNPAAGGAR